MNTDKPLNASENAPEARGSAERAIYHLEQIEKALAYAYDTFTVEQVGVRRELMLSVQHVAALRKYLEAALRSREDLKDDAKGTQA